MKTGFLIIIRKSQQAKFTIRMFEAVNKPLVLERKRNRIGFTPKKNPKKSSRWLNLRGEDPDDTAVSQSGEDQEDGIDDSQ